MSVRTKPLSEESLGKGTVQTKDDGDTEHHQMKTPARSHANYSMSGDRLLSLEYKLATLTAVCRVIAKEPTAYKGFDAFLDLLDG